MLVLDVGFTIFLNEISAILENTREGHAGLLFFPPIWKREAFSCQ